jgi:hypothetical protein
MGAIGTQFTSVKASLCEDNDRIVFSFVPQAAEQPS